MAFLLVVDGPNEGDYHPLEARPVTIGRNEDCTIQILDAEVSRVHMTVRRNEGGYTAVDERSANGVYINNSRIDGEAKLSNGDVIKIGNSEIIYSEQDFIDRDSAIEHYKRRAEHDRDTVVR